MKKASVVTLQHPVKPPTVWSEDIYIDKATAREWRDKKLFERQRPLSPENVIRLGSLMRKGKFTQGTQIYLCVYPNGAETIVNGNHTLEAICSCGIPQLLTVTRQLVDNINEAGAIYATFDQQRRRNLGDSFRAYGVSPGIKATTKFGSAVSSIARGFVEPEGRWRNRVDHSDIVALSANYMHEVSVFAEFTDRAPSDCKRLLYRAPIMGIILETLQHQPSLAEEFWGAIARDSGLEQDTPEHTFLRYFRNNPSVTSRELWANAASLAWNAKFRGDKACVIQPKGLKHFVLLGTPHDKGVVRSVGLNEDKEATEQEGIS
jgi:hypothetical protein